jgi:hypothetical protein
MKGFKPLKALQNKEYKSCCYTNLFVKLAYLQSPCSCCLLEPLALPLPLHPTGMAAMITMVIHPSRKFVITAMMVFAASMSDRAKSNRAKSDRSRRGVESQRGNAPSVQKYAIQKYVIKKQGRDKPELAASPPYSLSIFKGSL